MLLSQGKPLKRNRFLHFDDLVDAFRNAPHEAFVLCIDLVHPNTYTQLTIENKRSRLKVVVTKNKNVIAVSAQQLDTLYHHKIIPEYTEIFTDTFVITSDHLWPKALLQKITEFILRETEYANPRRTKPIIACFNSATVTLYRGGRIAGTPVHTPSGFGLDVETQSGISHLHVPSEHRDEVAKIAGLSYLVTYQDQIKVITQREYLDYFEEA